MARRWDPPVQERFHKLLLALGKEFDGKVEGINLPETVSISELVGFATEHLKIDYIFWCTQEPFYSQKLMPFLEEQR